MVILKYANINGEFDHVALLSVNVSVLQGLIAIFGIGIALAALFNFTQIKDKFKELENNYTKLNREYKLNIKDMGIKIDEIDKKLSSFIDNYKSNNHTNKKEGE